MSNFYKLYIKDVKRETPYAVSVAFTIPSELQSAYEYIAGQYITLKLTLDGKEIRRAYSLCSSPNSGELRIAIKSVQDGSFSNFANNNLKVGDIIEVSQPEGKFTFEPNAERQKNYAAFTAGSGITPVMSILKSVLESEPNSSFVLVYGNKSADETIFYQELHDLQQKYIGRLFVHYVFSQANNGDLFGRIDKAAVNFVLNNKHKEKEFDKFYLCGPEEMILLVSDVLKEHNISEKDIKFELFSTSSAKENKAVGNETGHTKITIMVDDEETTFEMSQKQTLLEAALKQGIDAPYSCQGGICSSCIARITNGTAEMKKNNILTDGEVADGLVLTCQAHPTSSEIYIDFDDV
jgi:ring-1,2-phenylacetyl-CoA epoxidase subunit PaaE